MKKIFKLTMFVTVLFLFNQANAKIRRVGYFGTPVTGTDYTSLQLAHDAASAKDTIMLFPGSWSASVSKKIVVLGYGYFVTGSGANANLQNITGSLSATINLYAGADSSVYEGIDNLNTYAVSAQTVNKVIIRRCNAKNIYFNDRTLDSWQILQSSVSSLKYGVYPSGKITNLRMDNCVVGQCNFEYNGTNLQTGQFTNDILYDARLGNGSFLIKNTVLLSYYSGKDNSVFQNSIANSYYDTIPTGNGNQNITRTVMENNVFVGYYFQTTYSYDGRFVLKAGSPAKGAGAGGTDAGIFGGTNPYKLSGIPRIPSFYKLTSPSTTTSSNPYTITFSVRSNN